MQQPSIEETIAFIQHAHGAKEYMPGVPYWKHPVAVMERLPADATDDEKRAALLHDVIEDTKYSYKDLAAMGYSQQVLDMVAGVTIPKAYVVWDSDEAFIAHYRSGIKAIVEGTKLMPDGKMRALSDDPVAHRGALRVKLADNQENTDEKMLAQLPPEKVDWFRRKYAGVGQMLKDGLRTLEQGQSVGR